MEKSWSKKFNEIVSGWKNYYFKNEAIEEISKDRAFICSLCELNTDGICDSNKQSTVIKDFKYGDKDLKEGDLQNGCSCPLEKKTRSENSQCPLGKW